MKFNLSVLTFVFGILSSVRATAVPWERLNRNDSVSFVRNYCVVYRLIHAQMVLVLDLQVGLYQLARDWDATLYKNNMIAHAAIGKLFDIPVVLTTSAETGELTC
jgi:hypothetical protein